MTRVSRVARSWCACAECGAGGLRLQRPGFPAMALRDSVADIRNGSSTGQQVRSRTRRSPDRMQGRTCGRRRPPRPLAAGGRGKRQHGSHVIAVFHHPLGQAGELDASAGVDAVVAGAIFARHGPHVGVDSEPRKRIRRRTPQKCRNRSSGCARGVPGWGEIRSMTSADGS
jgi:hypothetical protein